MTDKLVKYLQRQPLFKKAPEAVLQKIATQTEVRTLQKGDVLIRQGEPSESLFIIRTGWVKVVTEGAGGQEVTLNQVGPAQVIGEMSLVDRQPRSGTVVAVSPVTALEIKYSVVLAVVDEHPPLMQAFLRDMSERIRFSNAYIGESIEWCQAIADGNYDFVQEQMEQTRSTIVDLSQSHQARAGAFLSAFFQMVEGVKQREDQLKQQIQQLTIEIDEVKRQQAVQEITDTDFFENLKAAAQKYRDRRKSRETGDTE